MAPPFTWPLSQGFDLSGPKKLNEVVFDWKERESREITFIAFRLLLPLRVIRSMFAEAFRLVPRRRRFNGRGLPLVRQSSVGLPETLHADNGSDFRSRAFVRACRDAGIKIIWRIPGEPHYGGHIERLIGTMIGRSSVARHHSNQFCRERGL